MTGKQMVEMRNSETFLSTKSGQDLLSARVLFRCKWIPFLQNLTHKSKLLILWIRRNPPQKALRHQKRSGVLIAMAM